MRLSLAPFTVLLAASSLACAASPSVPRPTPTHTEGAVVDPSVVEDLLRARSDGTLVTPFAEARGLVLRDAYAVQGAVTRALIAGGDAVVGYKAAFNGAPTQARLGLDAPAWAPLLASMRVDPEEPAPVSVTGTVLAEVEVAFTLARAVEAVPSDRAALRALVASVHVALELPRVRFDAPPSGLDLVADGAAAHRFAVGPALPVEQLPPGPPSATLTLGEAALFEGEGADPWEGLATLLASVLEAGDPLPSGAVVLSGAIGRPVPLPALRGPAVLRASVAGLGALEVGVR